MKTTASFACLVVGAIQLSGCATGGAAYRERAAPQPGEMAVDARYISIVEAEARRRGLNVLWVNVPTGRVARTQP